MKAMQGSFLSRTKQRLKALGYQYQQWHRGINRGFTALFWSIALNIFPNQALIHAKTYDEQQHILRGKRSTKWLDNIFMGVAFLISLPLWVLGAPIAFFKGVMQPSSDREDKPYEFSALFCSRRAQKSLLRVWAITLMMVLGISLVVLFPAVGVAVSAVLDTMLALANTYFFSEATEAARLDRAATMDESALLREIDHLSEVEIDGISVDNILDYHRAGKMNALSSGIQMTEHYVFKYIKNHVNNKHLFEGLAFFKKEMFFDKTEKALYREEFILGTMETALQKGAVSGQQVNPLTLRAWAKDYVHLLWLVSVDPAMSLEEQNLARLNLEHLTAEQLLQCYHQSKQTKDAYEAVITLKSRVNELVQSAGNTQDSGLSEQAFSANDNHDNDEHLEKSQLSKIERIGQRIHWWHQYMSSGLTALLWSVVLMLSPREDLILVQTYEEQQKVLRQKLWSKVLDNVFLGIGFLLSIPFWVVGLPLSIIQGMSYHPGDEKKEDTYDFANFFCSKRARQSFMWVWVFSILLIVGFSFVGVLPAALGVLAAIFDTALVLLNTYFFSDATEAFRLDRRADSNYNNFIAKLTSEAPKISGAQLTLSDILSYHKNDEKLIEEDGALSEHYVLSFLKRNINNKTLFDSLSFFKKDMLKDDNGSIRSNSDILKGFKKALKGWDLAKPNVPKGGEEVDQDQLLSWAKDYAALLRIISADQTTLVMIQNRARVELENLDVNVMFKLDGVNHAQKIIKNSAILNDIERQLNDLNPGLIAQKGTAQFNTASDCFRANESTPVSSESESDDDLDEREPIAEHQSRSLPLTKRQLVFRRLGWWHKYITYGFNAILWGIVLSVHNRQDLVHADTYESQRAVIRKSGAWSRWTDNFFFVIAFALSLPTWVIGVPVALFQGLTFRPDNVKKDYQFDFANVFCSKRAQKALFWVWVFSIVLVLAFAFSSAFPAGIVIMAAIFYEGFKLANTYSFSEATDAFRTDRSLREVESKWMLLAPEKELEIKSKALSIESVLSQHYQENNKADEFDSPPLPDELIEYLSKNSNNPHLFEPFKFFKPDMFSDQISGCLYDHETIKAKLIEQLEDPLTALVTGETLLNWGQDYIKLLRVMALDRKLPFEMQQAARFKLKKLTPEQLFQLDSMAPQNNRISARVNTLEKLCLELERGLDQTTSASVDSQDSDKTKKPN